MNSSEPLDGICDSEAARLLPWFVTGRLSAEDSARISRHLGDCAICRADYEEQRALRAAIRTEGPVEYAPQEGLAKTLARIDELARGDAGPALPAAAVPVRRFGVTQWLIAAVLVQAIGLGTLIGVLLTRSSTPAQRPAYQTLSAPASGTSGPVIRAVFAAPMTMAQLKMLLSAQHLLIVTGPTEAGVFTLGAVESGGSDSEINSSLEGLRASPFVLFAEPVRADGAKSP